MTILRQEKFLLDTNIVIYLASESSWKDLYEPIITGKKLYICFMTLAELLEGAYHRGLSDKNINKLNQRLDNEYTILPFTEQVCDYFGRIRAARKNRPISVPDALVAATAMTYNSLVTHNRIDFDDISPKLRIVSQYHEPL